MKKLLNYITLTGILTISFIFLQSCQNVKKEKEISELIQTDQAFSKLTSDKGVKKALVNYVDTSELVLEKDFTPIDSKDAAIKYFSNSNDSGIVLTWKPLGANIVNAGNLGFTYGTYKIESIDSFSKGTYVTVWKKATDGRWKLALYTGKEPLGDKKELD
jgi:ketosteroid isomerase-like protein